MFDRHEFPHRESDHFGAEYDEWLDGREAEADGKKDLDSYHEWDMVQRRITESGEMRN